MDDISENDKIILEPTFDDSDDAIAKNVFKIPTVLTKNPIYPRDTIFKIWGTTEEPDGGISATINDRTYYSYIKNKAFVIYMDKFSAGGPFSMTVRTKEYKTIVKNILFGDIFIVSGQSNMEMLMASCEYPDDVENSSNSNIRLLKMSFNPSDAKVKDYRVSWNDASPVAVNNFSAAGYYFGKKIQSDINIPIGLIMSAVGDTSIMPWTPKDYTSLVPKVVYPGASPERRNYSCLFNGMIEPFINLVIKGVLWYQGENQIIRYDEQLSGMMTAWRKAFNQEFPFIIVQLPRFCMGDNESWFISREMQKTACKTVGNAYYSVNIDCGARSEDLNDAIHLKDKKPIGERAGNVALKYIYDKKEVLSSPYFESYTANEHELIIKLANAGSTLVKKNDGKGLEISYDGTNFEPIDYSLDGNFVKVSLIKKIKSFRYAYGAFPENSIYNAEGLPCEQFRQIV